MIRRALAWAGVACLLLACAVLVPARPVSAHPGITYNAGTDTITVTGGTEAAPYTFQDIAAADDAGGWNQVDNHFDNKGFTFHAKLVIGDGSTPTWFADNLVEVYWSSQIAATSTCILVTKNATLRFGILIENTSTKDGVAMFSYQSHLIANTGTPPGTILLYSSIFVNVANASPRTITFAAGGENSAIYNCQFYKIQLNLYAGKMPVNNYVADVAGIAINMPGITTFDTLRVVGCTYGFYGYTGTYTIRNATFANNTYDWYKYTADIYAIDSKSNWTCSFLSATGSVYRQYSFNLKVVENDNVGNPISGATVKLYDKNNNLIFEDTTADNGWIPEKTITHTKYMKDSTTTYYPFTLEISKTGYQTITIIDNFDQIKRSWTVSLLPTVAGGGGGETVYLRYPEIHVSLEHIQVFGTIYRPGENGCVWAQVLDNTAPSRQPVNDATVTVTIWRDNGDNYGGGTATYVTGSNGIYRYNFTAPSEVGVYLVDAKASYGAVSVFGSAEFQVEAWPENVTQTLENTLWIKDYLQNTVYPAIVQARDNAVLARDNAYATYNYLVNTILPSVLQARDNAVLSRDNAYNTYVYLTGTVKPELNQIQENVNYTRSQADNTKAVADNIQAGTNIAISDITATYNNTVTIIANTENIIDNCNTIYTFLIENLKAWKDEIYDYMIGTITSYLDNILASCGGGSAENLDNIIIKLDLVISRIGGWGDNFDSGTLFGLDNQSYLELLAVRVLLENARAEIGYAGMTETVYSDLQLAKRRFTYQVSAAVPDQYLTWLIGLGFLGFLIGGGFIVSNGKNRRVREFYIVAGVIFVLLILWVQGMLV